MTTPAPGSFPRSIPTPGSFPASPRVMDVVPAVDHPIRNTAGDLATGDPPPRPRSPRVHGAPVSTAALSASIAAAVCATVASTPASGQPVITETRKLVASDPAADDHFGFSVALTEGLAVVGAKLDDDSGPNSGSIYVLNPATGETVRKLRNPRTSSNDQLGWSVAADAGKVIGGTLSGDNALLFEIDVIGRKFEFKPDMEFEDSEFGRSVAISGNRVVVGDPRDDEVAENSGAAYVFDATTGQQLFKLKAPGSFLLGGRVAVSGDRAVVTSANTTGVYVFDINTGQQICYNQGTAEETCRLDRFGAGSSSSVAVSGDLAIIGSAFDSAEGTASGAAYIYNITTGQEVWRITPGTADGLRSGDQFGTSVAISGSRAIVGAKENDDAANNAGTAYVFDVTSGELLAQLLASDPGSLDILGESVAIDGDQALVGATLADTGNPGAAYYYDLSDFPTQIPGDTNQDRRVDVVDLNTLALNWQEMVDNKFADGDFNLDGKVDAVDLNAIATNWQVGVEEEASLTAFADAWAATLTAVPEPTSLSLLAATGPLLMRRRR